MLCRQSTRRGWGGTVQHIFGCSLVRLSHTISPYRLLVPRAGRGPWVTSAYKAYARVWRRSRVQDPKWTAPRDGSDPLYAMRAYMHYARRRRTGKEGRWTCT